MIYKGDIGTKITLDTEIDISSGTVFKIYYLKPDGTSGFWTAAKEADNQNISYTTLATTDLDVVGTWVIQSYVEVPGWKGLGLAVNMIVGVPVAEQAPAATVTTAEPTAAQMLTAVNQAIYAHLTGGAVQSYSIAGRNIQKISLNELYQIRDRLKSEVTGASGGGRNYVTFGNPS